MHIYEKPVLRKLRQPSIDGKENIIGKPVLFATTFDENSLESMPTVGEAQALHAGPRKFQALEKWKQLEVGSELPKLTTTPSMKERPRRRPLSELASPKVQSSSEFRYEFVDKQKVLPELPLFAGKPRPAQPGSPERDTPNLPTDDVYKARPVSYMDRPAQDFATSEPSGVATPALRGHWRGASGTTTALTPISDLSRATTPSLNVKGSATTAAKSTYLPYRPSGQSLTPESTNSRAETQHLGSQDHSSRQLPTPESSNPKLETGNVIHEVDASKSKQAETASWLKPSPAIVDIPPRTTSRAVHAVIVDPVEALNVVPLARLTGSQIDGQQLPASHSSWATPAISEEITPATPATFTTFETWDSPALRPVSQPPSPRQEIINLTGSHFSWTTSNTTQKSRQPGSNPATDASIHFSWTTQNTIQEPPAQFASSPNIEASTRSDLNSSNALEESQPQLLSSLHTETSPRLSGIEKILTQNSPTLQVPSPATEASTRFSWNTNNTIQTFPSPPTISQAEPNAPLRSSWAASNEITNAKVPPAAASEISVSTRLSWITDKTSTTPIQNSPQVRSLSRSASPSPITMSAAMKSFNRLSWTTQYTASTIPSTEPSPLIPQGLGLQPRPNQRISRLPSLAPSILNRQRPIARRDVSASPQLSLPSTTSFPSSPSNSQDTPDPSQPDSHGISDPVPPAHHATPTTTPSNPLGITTNNTILAHPNQQTHSGPYQKPLPNPPPLQSTLAFLRHRRAALELALLQLTDPARRPDVLHDSVAQRRADAERAAVVRTELAECRAREQEIGLKVYKRERQTGGGGWGGGLGVGEEGRGESALWVRRVGS